MPTQTSGLILQEREVTGRIEPLCVSYRYSVIFTYKHNCTDLIFIHSFIHQHSALEARLAGTRAQSCDRYGSDTLHPGQVLGGSLPLLSP